MVKIFKLIPFGSDCYVPGTRFDTADAVVGVTGLATLVVTKGDNPGLFFTGFLCESLLLTLCSYYKYFQ